MIDPYCRKGGPTVLHDLTLPIANMNLNIDHIVVSGDRLTILDTKSWKPGFIWTIRGHTRRGRKRFPPGDKHTMEMAEQSIAAFLHSRGVKFQMQQPLLIVWPSNRTKRLVITMFKPLGATPVRGTLFARHLRRYIGAVPADRTIVRALLPLVIDAQSSTPPPVRSGWLDRL